jgi:hypothetical protein
MAMLKNHPAPGIFRASKCNIAGPPYLKVRNIQCWHWLLLVIGDVFQQAV